MGLHADEDEEVPRLEPAALAGLVVLHDERFESFLGDGAGGSWGGARPYSEETAQKIDAEVQRIIRESHERARRLLAEHRGELDALARALLERETLDESEILAVTGLTRAPRLAGGKQPVSHAPDANQSRSDFG